MNRRLGAFAGLLSLLLLGALAAMLATGGPALSGSTGVPPSVEVVNLSPRQVACQRSGPLPADIGSVQVVTGSRSTHAARVVFYALDGPRFVARGATAGPPGTSRVPVSFYRPGRGVDRICIRNAGRAPFAVAGRPGGSIELGWQRKPVSATMSVLFVRSPSVSWLSQAGAIAGRFARVRLTPLGTGTLWLAIGLALGAAAAAVVATLLARRA